MGLGEAVTNPKILDSAVEELRAITGQKPVVTRAKKSIATFKLREGLPIGAMVTLRRERMWEFLDRLVTFALPRVRDFKGVSPKAFDGRGNYTLGLREQIIFPEIDYDKIDKIKGMNISFVTTAKTDEEGRALLQHLGMPFRQLGPMAKTVDMPASRKPPKFARAAPQPLPNLRSRARRSTAQVRAVPHLPPAVSRSRGEIPGVIKASW